MIQNQFITQKENFSNSEDMVWKKLYSKQILNLQNKAFPTFLENIKSFKLPINKVPLLSDVSDILRAATGWQVAPVSGLLDYDTYFTLLSKKKFPSTTFIRAQHEENLSKDPDIFHEIFGHCTMLLSHEYADFMAEYAKFALTVANKNRPLFARLIWFTTETGLIQIDNQLKIYGSSILSSYDESTYCLQKSGPIHKPFNIESIFREPFRADLLQRVYYVINDINQVYSLINNTSLLYKILYNARQLGEFAALFPIEQNKYSNIGHCYPYEVEIL